MIVNLIKDLTPNLKVDLIIDLIGDLTPKLMPNLRVDLKELWVHVGFLT